MSYWEDYPRLDRRDKQNGRRYDFPDVQNIMHRRTST